MRNRPRKTARRCASVDQRLRARLAPSASGCLEWMGSRTMTGYGTIKNAGARHLVHRIAWELEHGPIPDGMLVCHHCDNPPCCNPEHLFLGTQSDNLVNMRAKRRHRNPPRPIAKLSAEATSSVCARWQTGTSQQSLAKEFGVSQATVSRIVRDQKQRQHACE